ncbi:hypothetical protein DFH06DRAFT_768829 [Mycena polygramma]|nr:hypothetical protein DFH06DRAFT_768829 [Mycena polygramma]
MLSFFPASPLRVLTLSLCLRCIVVQAATAKDTQRTHRKRDAFSDSELSLASWIWLPEPDLIAAAPAGDVAFFRTLATPTGKTAASARIAMTADNNFTLWVNGQPVGASASVDEQVGWQSAQIFSAALNTSANVFSVVAENAVGAANPAGLLTTIHILFTDGSNETIVSDNAWLASGTIPGDFPLPADLSTFVPAEVAAKYGAGPWGTSVKVLDANPLALNGSAWIWSTSNASSNAPVGTVGFRRTVGAPEGKTASSATVLLSVDNTFQLYVNGQYVGSPPFDDNVQGTVGSWEFAQRFAVSLTPSTNVFTVLATNFAPQQAGATSGAGFIAALQVEYTDGSSEIVRTDATWLTGAFTSASAFLTTPDSTLVPSITQGSYGMAPWGQIGTSDALNVLKLPGNNAAITSSPSAVQTLQLPTTPLPTLTSSNSPAASPSTGGARVNRSAPMFLLALCISIIL